MLQRLLKFDLGGAFVCASSEISPSRFSTGNLEEFIVFGSDAPNVFSRQVSGGEPAAGVERWLKRETVHTQIHYGFYFC